MSREHRNEDSWLFSMKMQTRTQSPPSKTIGNDYHGMREKEKGKESSVVCLCEREREQERERERGGRWRRQATQRISTQADLETSQKEKKVSNTSDREHPSQQIRANVASL